MLIRRMLVGLGGPVREQPTHGAASSRVHASPRPLRWRDCSCTGCCSGEVTLAGRGRPDRAELYASATLSPSSCCTCVGGRIGETSLGRSSSTHARYVCAGAPSRRPPAWSSREVPHLWGPTTVRCGTREEGRARPNSSPSSRCTGVAGPFARLRAQLTFLEQWLSPSPAPRRPHEF